jgi:hypothetical protein
MARTISQIQNQILAQITADPVLGTKLTSPSQVAIYNVFSFIVATALSVEENLRDIFQTEIEADIFNAPPGTPQWIVKMVKYFQYSAVTPQYVAVDNFTISYPVVNPSYNVVAQCAVVTLPFRTVEIKIAPADTSSCFDNIPGIFPYGSTGAGPTVNALSAYLDLINFAGVQFSIVNLYPDYFMCGANIYYDGQFGPSVTANVSVAINNYLANLPFNGVISLYGGYNDPGLINVIQSVQGVLDVEFTNVAIRPNNTSVMMLLTWYQIRKLYRVIMAPYRAAPCKMLPVAEPLPKP